MDINTDNSRWANLVKNDAEYHLRSQKGETVKKTSSSQTDEVSRRDKVESTNETVLNTKEEQDIVDSVLNMIKQGRDLHFEKTDYGEQILKIVDEEGEVVRQIPTDISLKVSRAIKEYMSTQNMGVNNKENNNDTL